MKTHNCEQCRNFVNSIWSDEIKLIQKAKCSKGNRLRFVLSRITWSGNYRRKCEMFENILQISKD